MYYFSMRPSYTDFVVHNPEVHLRYNNELERATLSKADEQDKFLLRLNNSSDSTTEMLVSLRYEDDLKPLTLTKRNLNLRDVLLENVSKTYTERFPGYYELSRRSFIHNDHDAGEILFTYTGRDGQTIQQRFVVFVCNDNQAIYLAAQALQSDFDRLNKAYFEDIITSVSL